MKIIAEREHYLLVSDGRRFTVVERRAGKFYPLCNGIRHGCDLDDEGVAELVRRVGLVFREREARRRLADVAGRWRDLFEHVRCDRTCVFSRNSGCAEGNPSCGLSSRRLPSVFGAELQHAAAATLMKRCIRWRDPKNIAVIANSRHRQGGVFNGATCLSTRYPLMTHNRDEQVA